MNIIRVCNCQVRNVSNGYRSFFSKVLKFKIESKKGENISHQERISDAVNVVVLNVESDSFSITPSKYGAGEVNM